MSDRYTRSRSFVYATISAIALMMLVLLSISASAQTQPTTDDTTASAWQQLSSQPSDVSSSGNSRAIHARKFRAFAFRRGDLQKLIAAAPRERTLAAREGRMRIALPMPGGGFQRFKIYESPIMEAGLAAKHPEIKTYAGRGIDDPSASLRFDVSPLGFHASVRSATGTWYIDPYYHHEDSTYVAYYVRDLEPPTSQLLEREGTGAEISVTKPYYHPEDTVEMNGSGFLPNTAVNLTFSDSNGPTGRTLSATSDDSGAFAIEFVAEPGGALGVYTVEASDGTNAAATLVEVVTPEDLSHDPAVGDILKVYRLALVSETTYATYFHGANDTETNNNVTAAKVVLMNRVNQVYESEFAIRMVLIANNDLLNLNTAAIATAANGPCGGSGCFTTANLSTCGNGTLTRNRIVAGLLVGASAYDVGHIIMGTNGGGLSALGVIGASNKAQSCTGVPTPIGDYYAVDYVAHEMGHEFGGNHTFNGTQSNCSGGNRNASTSVEPGSGSSIMAYAGICQTDDLQPHSDPYFSEKSFDEIITYTSSTDTNINEVINGVLTGFTTNGESFQLQYHGNTSAAITRGSNYTVAGIKAALEPLTGATVTASTVGDTAFTITFSGALAGTDIDPVTLVNCTGGCSGYVGEITKGGLTTKNGYQQIATGDHPPVVTVAAAQYTIPLRTPFYLTGSATDQDGDTITYMWEQTDRGGSSGTGLVSNTKTNGPLFRQFGTVAQVSTAQSQTYNSPNENHTTTDPLRYFPDMAQIIANNTNAETGTCPTAQPNPTSISDKECFSEFLPTAAYVGFTNVNASPLSLHFRLTARDGRNGVNLGTTTLLLATGAGPFLVTSPNTAITWKGNSVHNVTWNKANTDASPVSTANVKISLSTDGGFTYPYVLSASTPNNGTASVTMPNISTTHARVKVEAVDNVFFDISNADFNIPGVPDVTNSLNGGSQTVQYGDSLSPDVTVTATDPDSPGSSLTASATGLPAGLSLQLVSSVNTLPGSKVWKIGGFAMGNAGTYNVVVTVTDESGNTGSTSFSIVVTSANLVATATLTKQGNGTYLANVSVKNNGTGTARNAVLSGATLGTGTGSPLPISLGDIAPGATATAAVTFPASSGTSGSAVVEKYSGSYTGKTFTTSVKATLP